METDEQHIHENVTDIMEVVHVVLLLLISHQHLDLQLLDGVQIYEIIQMNGHDE
jgi:hypothetical protein